MAHHLFQAGHIDGPIHLRNVITSEEEGDLLTGRKSGDLVARHGYILQWDDNCVDLTELLKWRQQGDDACDHVIKVLNISPGQDGLERLEAYMTTTPVADLDLLVCQFWEEITSLPPHFKLTEKDDLSFNPTKIKLGTPTPRTVSGGQQVFWRYAAEIFNALMHFSLAGFSAPKLVSVLQETGYLTTPNRDATYRRLLETTQFVLDAMTDMTPVTGQGWKSTIRVRMLHSQVRLRLLSGRGLEQNYRVEEDGIPINQEDLIATLGAFAVAPLWSLRRMKIYVSKDEEAAYITTWSFIGHYMGISSNHLRRHYSGVNLVCKSEKLFAITAVHLFSDHPPHHHKSPNPLDTITFRVLLAVSNRPPRGKGVFEHCEMSRFLLGSALADRFYLPRGTFIDVFNVRINVLSMWFLNLFGKWYWRIGWEIERVTITNQLLKMIVSWQLGSRRTKFTQKTSVTSTLEVHDLRCDSESVVDDDSSKRRQAGKQMVERWYWLLGEMIIVVAIIGLFSVTLAFIVVVKLKSFIPRLIGV